MKKSKKLHIAAITAVSIGCFFIGRATVHYENITEPKQTVQAIQTETKTTLDLNDPKDFELACDFVGKIVDFNTDGKELSLMTSDGYELYAYKSQNIYRNHLFVPIDGTERE